MLIKKDLLEAADEQYRPMLKEVSIPDFTKCIAQFSGLHISKVSDEVIKAYLLTWAKNKYRFYQLLGNKLKVDNKIQYKDENKDVETEMRALEKDFPAYALWLEGFKYVESNKINIRDVDWNIRSTVDNIFPGCRLDSCSVTHFFKSYLNAPDELVTKIGRIWENEMVEGIYTISIDPVDMMLASENPYNWQSCYRLAVDNDCSHADGCMAAILDDSSLITYVWNREGKFSLYNTYEFKSVRYYRMREWISISPNQTAIHFNAIYPGKRYTDDFEKSLRRVVEDLVNKDATWQKNDGWDINCNRALCYGYGEFDSYRIYKIKDAKDEIWETYNEQILCPCGCGDYLAGSDWDDDYEGYEYNGEGFIAENFYEKEDDRQWCEYCDDYCENEEYCDNCPHWNRAHPVCELDDNETCDNADEAEDDNKFDPYEDNVVHCGDHCEGCPLYKIHHPEKEEEPEEKLKTAMESLHINLDELPKGTTTTGYDWATGPSLFATVEPTLYEPYQYYTWPAYPDKEPNSSRDI